MSVYDKYIKDEMDRGGYKYEWTKSESKEVGYCDRELMETYDIPSQL